MLCVHNIIPVQLSSQLAAVQLYYQSKLLSSLDQNKKKIKYLFIIFVLLHLHDWISIFKGGKWCQPHRSPTMFDQWAHLFILGRCWLAIPGHKRAPRFKRDPPCSHMPLFSHPLVSCHVCKLMDCTATMPKRATSEEGEISGPDQARLGLALFESWGVARADRD